MSVRSFVFLVGGLSGLLLGSFVGAGCTPGSSSSSPSPDTATSSASASVEASRPETTSAPTGDVSAEPDDARTVAQRLEDASVAARVKQALVRTESLRPFDFSPTANRGHLILRGNVDTREQYRRAERIAGNVDGVDTVANQVTVDGRAVVDADESSTGATESEAAYHTVRRGDTLSEIARKYGVSVQQLRRLNDLSSSLQPGDRLRIR